MISYQTMTKTLYFRNWDSLLNWRHDIQALSSPPRLTTTAAHLLSERSISVLMKTAGGLEGPDTDTDTVSLSFLSLLSLSSLSPFSSLSLSLPALFSIFHPLFHTNFSDNEHQYIPSDTWGGMPWSQTARGGWSWCAEEGGGVAEGWRLPLPFNIVLTTSQGDRICTENPETTQASYCWECLLHVYYMYIMYIICILCILYVYIYVYKYMYIVACNI